MKQCCKVYLVPEDVIQTWRAEQREKSVDRPSETVISNLDANMTQLLDAKDLNDYDKEKLFSQELAKFRNMRKQQQMTHYNQQQQNLQMLVQPPTSGETLTSSNSSMEEAVLASIPKMYRSKAAGFIQYLKSDANVAWDDRGQLVLKGTTYPGTHMVDLINDALRFRKKMSRPTGWRELSSHLMQRNVPRELMGNEQLIKGASSPPPPPFSSSSSSSMPQTTPKSSSSRPHHIKTMTTPKRSKWPTSVDYLLSTIKKKKKQMTPQTFHTPITTPPELGSWEDVLDSDD